MSAGGILLHQSITETHQKHNRVLPVSSVTSKDPQDIDYGMVEESYEDSCHSRNKMKQASKLIGLC